MDSTVDAPRRILIEVDLAEGLELLNGVITRREYLRDQQSAAAMRRPRVPGSPPTATVLDDALALNARAETALRHALEVPREEDDLSLGDHFAYPS